MMPTQLANDNHRMIIVTDNPTTRLDYDKLLQSSSQPHSSPVLGLAEPDWIVQNEQESETPPFHFDFAFTAAEGIEKIKASRHASLPYAVVVIDLQTQPPENEIELAKQVWEVDPRVEVVTCGVNHLGDINSGRRTMSLPPTAPRKPLPAMELERLKVLLAGYRNSSDQHPREPNTLFSW